MSRKCLAANSCSKQRVVAATPGMRAYHKHGQRRGALCILQLLRFNANQSSHTKSGTYPTSYRSLLLAVCEYMYKTRALSISHAFELSFSAIFAKRAKKFDVKALTDTGQPFWRITHANHARLKIFNVRFREKYKTDASRTLRPKKISNDKQDAA